MEEALYCLQEAWLFVFFMQLLSLAIPLLTQHTMAFLPALSRRNAASGALATDRCQTNCSTEDERTALHPLSLEAVRGCSGKHLLLCKTTKAKLEVLEILQFLPTMVEPLREQSTSSGGDENNKIVDIPYFESRAKRIAC